MNYFAHACLAARCSGDARFALGAMLPDWTPWLGVRLARVDDPALAAGVRFHHRSDAAFHTSPRFGAWVREAAARLRAAGLGRGPARGAAHVGVELLLDGALLAEPRRGEAYLGAVEAAGGAAARLIWSRPEGAHRFELLRRHLAREGLPVAYRDPEQVARRTTRALERRPRLRVPPAALPALARWARESQPALQRDADRILAETEARLALTGPGAGAARASAPDRWR